MIFRVGISEINSYNLSDKALGKFSFMVNEKPHGFYRSRREAEESFGRELSREGSTKWG
jgi:hypothetical protein